MAWYDTINQQYGGSDQKKATAKTGSWIDKINAQYSEKKEVKKETPIPLAFKQPVKLTGKTTISSAKPKTISSEGLNLQGKGGFLGKMVEKAVNVPTTAVKEFVNRVGDLFAFESVPETPYKTPEQDTPVKRVAGVANVATSAIGLIPQWLAFSTGLEVAKETPVIKYPAKALSYGFGKLGEVGAYVGGKAVDIAPISEPSKEILRQPIQEISAIISQVGLAKVGHSAIKKYVPIIKEKIKSKQKVGTEITPEISKQIVNEAVKEIPLPKQEATVKIPTATGEIKVKTNQKIVLQNFIKNREDINYKTAKTLGKDINGEPIMARFEWDYKKKQATIYTTNKTTASNLAHELGHYYDRKLSFISSERFSDLFPDYLKNKEQIDNAMASYIIDKNGGNVSAKEISSKIQTTLGEFKKELVRISQRDTANEQFADGVKEFIINPENARKVAPEFSNWIEYNLKDSGLLAGRIQLAVNKTSEVIKSMPQTPPQASGEAITPKEAQPLIQEAKQAIKEGKSAEEFVKAQESDYLYHGTNKTTLENIQKEGIVPQRRGVSSFSKSEEYSKNWSDNPYTNTKGVMFRIKKDILDGKIVKRKGSMPETDRQFEILTNQVVSPKDIELKTPEGWRSLTTNELRPTKSQLIDIYNQAKAEATPSEKFLAKPIEAKPTESKFAGTQLKTGKVVEKRLSYNPDKINAPEDVETLIKGVSKAGKEFKEQRISKTDENLKALANEVDISVDDLLKVNPGSIANAETVFKSRQILSDLAQDLRDTIKKTTTETASPAELQAIKNKLFRLQGVMKTVAGLRTEASNVFRSFKLETMAGENDIMTDLVSRLKKIDAKAGDDMSLFLKGSKELLEPTIADKAWHLWYMSILSGESTQIKNNSGNFAQLVGELTATSARNPKELPTSVLGLYKGLQEGFTKAKQIMKEGETSKFEERGLKPIVFTGKAKLLNYFGYVGRFMAAIDALAREGFKGMEAFGKARDIAIKEGYQGEKLKSRILELKDELLKSDEEVKVFGERGIYTQKPQGALGVMAEGIGKIVGKIPGAKLIVPFTRIVANVTNNSLDWTPLGLKRALIKPTTIKGVKIFREGGFLADYYKDPLTARQRGQAIARGALGTVGMAYLATVASEGNLSGSGPTDYRKRQQLKDAGWRENSIRIGNTWYPYQNWGPMAVPMTLVGNYYDAQKYNNIKADDLLSRTALAAFGSVASIIDMSFLSGLNDLSSALEDPSQAKSYLKNFVAQQASSPIPNLYKQTARYFDPTVYETNNIKEKIYSSLRITSGLKPKINVFGQVIKGERLTELEPVSETKDPLIKYLADNQIYISVPSKATKVRNANGDKVQMTDDQYYEYVKQSGEKIHDILTERLEYIKALEPDRKEKYIDDEVSRIRDEIKYKFYGK